MDLLDHNSFVEDSLQSVRKIQKQVPKDIAVVLGLVEQNPSLQGKALVNSAVVLLNGEIVFRQHKSLLPSYDVFDESRYFEPAKEYGCFEWKGKKIGIAICEDMWWESEFQSGERYALDPIKELLDRGAELLLVPSASPFHSKKILTRLQLMGRIGRSSAVPVVYVNMIGGNDSLIFDGNSMATNTEGELIHACPAFEESLEFLNPFEKAEILGLTIHKEEELLNALVLGVKDYIHKTGFSRVHFGLSGGIDSALVAVIAAYALGPENVTAFLLPSKYSSEGSIVDAEALAKNLGITYHTVAINPMVERFDSGLAEVFKGTQEDVTEENIQARIRGTILMAYSNKYASLLLSTGNKSELGVGYCTLYGDMAGAIGVIGDLFKTEVYDLCRYINKEKEVIPEAIITKPPSAELRPDQKDQDSLPDYDILDKILYEYLILSKTGPEITKDGFDADTVNKVLRLVGFSEYKRRQAAPVLRVSPRAFGTGRRMPIARKFYEA
jgi:NAD+ synthase (glutamine-hydrolysing)